MNNRGSELIELMRAFQAVARQEAERNRPFGAAIAGRSKLAVNPVPALVDLVRRLTKRQKRVVPKPTN